MYINNKCETRFQLLFKSGKRCITAKVIENNCLKLGQTRNVGASGKGGGLISLSAWNAGFN